MLPSLIQGTMTVVAIDSHHSGLLSLMIFLLFLLFPVIISIACWDLRWLYGLFEDDVLIAFHLMLIDAPLRGFWVIFLRALGSATIDE